MTTPNPANVPADAAKVAADETGILNDEKFDAAIVADEESKEATLAADAAQEAADAEAAPVVVPPVTPPVTPPATGQQPFAKIAAIFPERITPAAAATLIGLPKWPFFMSFLTGATKASMISSASGVIAAANAAGARLILPINFCSDDVAATGISGAQAVAAGSQDDMLLSVAKAAVAGGQANAIVRGGWEMNLSVNGSGNIPSFSGTAAQVAYTTWWNEHLVPVFRSVPGQKFEFCWNPSLAPSNPADGFQPAKGNVDLVGIDYYDRYPGNGTLNGVPYPGAAASFAYYLSKANPNLNQCVAWAKALGARLAFCETGLGWTDAWGTAGGDNGGFYTQLFAWVAAQTIPVEFFNVYGATTLSASNPNTIAILKAESLSSAPA